MERNKVLTEKDILNLIYRMELIPVLLKRYIEEQIVSLVKLPNEWQQKALEQFLNVEKIQMNDLDKWLSKKCWSKEDLNLHLSRSEALYRFSKQRFGPGLEEKYLSTAADLDTVIYSLVRVKDSLLAKELWMRLSEKEVNFVDLASNYGEGPEAQRKGLIGPVPFGSLQPKPIRTLLRELAPGEFTRPARFGEWSLIMRLEQITPASFDENMREKLLQEQLNTFIEDRSKALIEGISVEPLHFDPES
tara:strand:- start:971 stop:1711 length:741 start_codon:yes stop_codon:yes gene_type:complete